MIRSFRIAFGVIALTAAIQTTSSAQPAPPLTNVRVYAVCSSGAPAWEYPAVGAISTKNNDSGPILYVAVLETGYSSWRQATFGGRPMTLVQSIPQVNAYHQIWGYIQIYEYVGSFKSGSFACEAESLVAPYRELSTSFNIL